MKKIIFLFALFLAACAAPAPQLSPEMVASMTARADLYDAQYPGMAETNVARLCVTAPIGRYWHEEGQIWAVICEVPLQSSLPNMYGAVLMDRSYTVLSTEQVSASSRSALEDLVFSVGWEAR